MPDRCDVAIIGAGFAGSILARLLARAGQRVVLIERGRHPRFALGESSTPLAALSLERLASAHGLADLHALAAWGRARRELPELRLGLKRGFTFFSHQPGRTLGGSEEERLLVAASPRDEIADVHWLRSDVDAHLASAARAAGAELRERCAVTAVEPGGDGTLLRLQRGDRRESLAARFVVDASGPGEIPGLPGRLDRPSRARTHLLFAHVAGLAPLAEVAPAALSPAGPYPDERAAIHHLLPDGWLYVLPFDHGVASIGLERHGVASGAERRDPAGALRAALAPYPTLARQLAASTVVHGVGFAPRVQHRRRVAAGPGWLALPHAHAFTSPLFSTGLALSLRGVERAAALLAGGAPHPAAVGRYARRAVREARFLDRLQAGALRATASLDRFAPWALLYFAAASWSESRERLCAPPDGGWAEAPFLSAGDPVFGSALTRLEAPEPEPETAGTVRDALLAALALRDVAGLGRRGRHGHYPVDFEALVDAAPLLGLSAEEVRRNTARLRGGG